MDYNVKCLGLKRQLDQSVVLEPTLKLHKTLFFAINGADVYLWRNRKEDRADLSDTYISADTVSGPLEYAILWLYLAMWIMVIYREI